MKEPKSPSAANPVRRKPLVILILDQLREFITSARLKSGDRLPPERQLAIQLEVSRPSLRAALDWLSERGALRRVQGGGTYLEPNINSVLAEARDRDLVEKAKLAEVIEARLLLEPPLAELAAKKGTPEEFKELHAELDRTPQSLNDPLEYCQHELQFHIRLARMAGNRILTGMLELLFPHFMAFFHTHSNQIPSESILDSHRAILSALESRDPKAASHEMTRYLQRYQVLLTTIEEASGDDLLAHDPAAEASSDDNLNFSRDGFGLNSDF